MQQVRCQPPPSPSPCFYDSMRPAEAPGLLDFKRLTKANMLMVAGQKRLGQKGWDKTQKADEPKGKSRTQYSWPGTLLEWCKTQICACHAQTPVKSRHDNCPVHTSKQAVVSPPWVWWSLPFLLASPPLWPTLPKPTCAPNQNCAPVDPPPVQHATQRQCPRNTSLRVMYLVVALCSLSCVIFSVPLNPLQAKPFSLEHTKGSIRQPWIITS